MEPRALEHYSRREQQPGNFALALGALRERIIGHFLNNFELVLALAAPVDIRRHLLHLNKSP